MKAIHQFYIIGMIYLYYGKEIRVIRKEFRKKIGYTPQLQGMYEDYIAKQFLHYIGGSVLFQEECDSVCF